MFPIHKGFPAATMRPEPGIYTDVPAEQYHGLRMASSHVLKMLDAKSPMHVEYERNHPKPATDAFRIGSAAHTMVLEPHFFERKHPIAEPCAAITGKGEPCKNTGNMRTTDGKWWCGTHKKPDGVYPDGAITLAEAETVGSINDAVRARKRSGQLLRDTTGYNELTIIWDRPVLLPGGVEYILRCKLRADMVRPRYRTCADLKSTLDASEDAFARDVRKLKYHWQGGHYMEGLQVSGFTDIDSYSFIVPEKKPPFAVAECRLNNVSIEAGQLELKPVYHQYAICEQSGEWPGYPEEFIEVGLSSFDLKRIGL